MMFFQITVEANAADPWVAVQSFMYFAGTFVVLWLVGSFSAKYLGRKSPIVFLGGNDDRLSMAKFQAFVWTLVVISSYFALMAIHNFEKKPDWIDIPDQLLILCGIVIANNVFSSTISAFNEEQRTAVVTDFKFENNLITIGGRNLGNEKGAVRIYISGKGKWELAINSWSDTSVIISAVEKVSGFLTTGVTFIDDYKKPNILIVDTSNGKAAYYLTKKAQTDEGIELGQATIYYEFVDFFRDDLNPSILSIPKYQLFCWTIVAVLLYIFLFLKLGRDAESLPQIHTTVVILMGISNGAYLGGKLQIMPKQ